MQQIHGGDWKSFQSVYGGAPTLDFSVNLHPLGTPPAVREALRAAVPLADRYPDPRCRDLCQALGRQLNLPPEHILCGNGASDLIYRAVLALRPRRALIPVPSFAEYEASLAPVRCETIRFPLPFPFRLNDRILSAITPDTDLLFLAQPNNPSGLTVPRNLLLRILDRCQETDTRLVLDESFVEFLTDPDAFSLVSCLDHPTHPLLLRSMTKLYCIPGVRLGYALCADRTLLDAMETASPPWSVSVLAQAAGLAALADPEHPVSTRRFLEQERPFLQQGLEHLGLTVIPGEANFLLFRSPVPLDEALARRGILLRNCGSFPGLNPLWYRTAVRTREENRVLLNCIKEVLAE